MTLQEKTEMTLWAAHTLFDRNKTSGTTANISFLHDGAAYVSRSGSCFGTLKAEDFVRVNPDGSYNQAAGKPSKEYALHRMLYENNPSVNAVIHVHSPYAVLWSCLEHENRRDVFPHITPYLEMKLGHVAEVPYAAPGSRELFDAFAFCLGPERGYLLKNHGPIVGGTSMMNAFEAIEELEQTAFVCWELKKQGLL